MGQGDRLQALFGRAAWRTEVEVRRRELEHRLEVALAEHATVAPTVERPARTERVEIEGANASVTLTLEEHETKAQPVPQALSSHEHAVRQALQDAQLAVDSDASVSDWINGSSVTMAWESVHEAAAELVELESDDAVRSSLPRLVDWIQEVMDKDSPLRKRYETDLTAIIDRAACVNGRLHMAGVVVSYRFDNGAPNCVKTITVTGAPISPVRTYHVATIDYLLLGGDGHTGFAKGTNVIYGDVEVDVVAAYITAHSPVSPKVEGRLASS